MSSTINDVIDYNEIFLTKEKATALFNQLMSYSDLTNMVKIETESGEKFNLNFGKMMFLDNELIAKNALPKSIWGNTMEWSEHIIPIKKQVEN
ncbi:hypothetical protein ACOCEA_12930 [Maribacter sp. CXY002]|uniref:hypothetical protein n=1 Tax=Maribacter luteocoastalis TaxID=3407671 RepID=UPI003B679418